MLAVSKKKLPASTYPAVDIAQARRTYLVKMVSKIFGSTGENRVIGLSFLILILLLSLAGEGVVLVALSFFAGLII